MLLKIWCNLAPTRVWSEKRLVYVFGMDWFDGLVIVSTLLYCKIVFGLE